VISRGTIDITFGVQAVVAIVERKVTERVGFEVLFQSTYVVVLDLTLSPALELDSGKVSISMLRC
jgi:hypothetical protein